MHFLAQTNKHIPSLFKVLAGSPKRNRRFARWGARNAPARCERPKDQIQIRREPPIH